MTMLAIMTIGQTHPPGRCGQSVPEMMTNTNDADETAIDTGGLASICTHTSAGAGTSDPLRL